VTGMIDSLVSFPPVRLALGGIARIAAGNHSPVFTVHNLCVPDASTPGQRFLNRWSDLDARTFSACLEELPRRFRLVTCSELARRLGEASMDKRPFAALTFDDAYRDFLTHALPALKQAGIPATLFAVTGLLETGELPWPLKLHLLAERIAARNGGTWPGEVMGEMLDAPGEGRTPQALADFLEQEIVRSRPEQIRPLLSNWAHRLGVDPAEINEPGLTLTWEELDEVRNAGIEIGSHSVHHPWFGLLDDAAKLNELEGSRRALENRLGIRVEGFCIPRGGLQDAAACGAELVAAAGYRYLCTSLHGFNRDAGQRMGLRRTPLRTENPARFQLRLDGAFELAHELRHRWGAKGN